MRLSRTRSSTVNGSPAAGAAVAARATPPTAAPPSAASAYSRTLRPGETWCMSANLLGGNRPRLGPRALHPFLKRRVLEHARHVPARGLRDACAVGIEAQHDRSVHRIRDRVVAEQPGSAAAEAAAAVVPQLIDPLDVGGERGQQRGAPI